MLLNYYWCSVINNGLNYFAYIKEILFLYTYIYQEILLVPLDHPQDT